MSEHDELTAKVRVKQGKIEQRMENDRTYRVGQILATIFAWSIAVLILGTLFGLWVKFFWLGVVFSGGC